MSTEENFDDLLKSKLSETEFAFNEANWEKAEALILTANKKRKKKRIAFIFFIGLLLGICFMIPFTIEDKIKSEIKIKGETKVKTENKMDADSVAKTNLEKIDNLTVNNRNEAKVEIKPSDDTKEQIKTNNKIENDYVTKQNAEKTGSLKANKESKAKIESKAEGGTKKQIKAKNRIKIKNEIKYKNTQKENAIKVAAFQKESNVNIASSENKTINNSKIVKLKSQSGKSENAKNKNAAIGNSVTKTDQMVTNNLNKKDKPSANNEINNDTSKPVSEIKKQEDNITTSKKTDSTSVVTSMINQLVKDTTVAIKDSVAKTKTDSVIPAKNNEVEIFKPYTTFFIDAGANYAFGWTNGLTKEANGFNGVGGFSAAHYFTKKWSVLIGLQYNSLAHLNYSNYTNSNIQYDFGVNETKTTITPTILRYLAIPFKLQYHFNDKNSISIGLNTLYLVNTSSTMEVYKQTMLNGSSTEVSTKTGYRDGFSTWDLQPAIAYRRKLYMGFSISAEAYYGLIDIKSNTTFGINKAEYNTGLKLTLSYNILHK